MVLHEVYQGVWENYYTDGKYVEEGHQITVE
jgi:hypothetical protein